VINKLDYNSSTAGVTWDKAASPPDAYVVVKVGSGTGVKSKYIDDTYTPQWDFTVEATLNVNDSLSFTLWEQDDWTSDEYIGALEYKSGVPIADLQKGSHQWISPNTTDGIQELHYSFEPK